MINLDKNLQKFILMLKRISTEEHYNYENRELQNAKNTGTLKRNKTTVLSISFRKSFFA